MGATVYVYLIGCSSGSSSFLSAGCHVLVINGGDFKQTTIETERRKAGTLRLRSGKDLGKIRSKLQPQPGIFCHPNATVRTNECKPFRRLWEDRASRTSFSARFDEQMRRTAAVVVCESTPDHGNGISHKGLLHILALQTNLLAFSNQSKVLKLSNQTSPNITQTWPNQYLVTFFWAIKFQDKLNHYFSNDKPIVRHFRTNEQRLLNRWSLYGLRGVDWVQPFEFNPI